MHINYRHDLLEHSAYSDAIMLVVKFYGTSSVSSDRRIKGIHVVL